MATPKKPTSAPRVIDPRFDSSDASHLTQVERELLFSVYEAGFNYPAFALALAKEVAALAVVHPIFRRHVENAMRDSARTENAGDRIAALRLLVEYDRARDHGMSAADALEKLGAQYGAAGKTIDRRLTAARSLIGIHPKSRPRPPQKRPPK